MQNRKIRPATRPLLFRTLAPLRRRERINLSRVRDSSEPAESHLGPFSHTARREERTLGWRRALRILMPAWQINSFGGVLLFRARTDLVFSFAIVDTRGKLGMWCNNFRNFISMINGVKMNQEGEWEDYMKKKSEIFARQASYAKTTRWVLHRTLHLTI